MDIQKKIIKKIKEFDTIIIHRHQRPDPDAIGSQLGLKEILQNSFPGKKVYAVGEEATGLNWVGSMDKISNNVYKNALVIVIDTANVDRIDDKRYKKGSFIIKIDHHPNDEPFGGLIWDEPKRSSSSEMITYLGINNASLSVNNRAARYLYIGIVGDTGRFMYSSHPQTFKAVSYLYKYDVNFNSINRKMSSITLAQARFSGLIYQKMGIKNHVAWIILTKKMIQEANLKSDGTNFVVGMFGSIEEVNVWANFIENNDGSYRVRLRSKGPSINQIAKKYHGGGHKLASGAKARDSNEIKNIIKDLLSLVKG